MQSRSKNGLPIRHICCGQNYNCSEEGLNSQKMHPTETYHNNRSWDVLLIGGSSGIGKTTIAYRLAQHYAVSLTLGDDLYRVVQQIATPEEHPILHYWSTHPEVQDWPPEQILELHLGVCRLMTPAFVSVAASHLKHRRPIILEGVYILPEVAASKVYEDIPGVTRARAVFLYEPEEQQIVRNLVTRKPHQKEQNKRARVSWLFGQWLRDECQRYGQTALPCRPWDNLLERIIEATI